MTGKTVMTYSIPHNEFTSSNTSEVMFNYTREHLYKYTPMEVATAVTLMVGIYQVIFHQFILCLDKINNCILCFF